MFSKSSQKKGVQIFSHKKGVVSKVGVGGFQLFSSLETVSNTFFLCRYFTHLHYFYQSSLCFSGKT